MPAIYASSKAALANASEAWRLELAPFSVRVVSIVIGVVAPNFFANVPDYATPGGSVYGSWSRIFEILKRRLGILYQLTTMLIAWFLLSL
jgi:NAD(P)-dependent dehydrogenase (short-subunit alcohol dehydrogenase family)